MWDVLVFFNLFICLGSLLLLLKKIEQQICKQKIYIYIYYILKRKITEVVSLHENASDLVSHEYTSLLSTFSKQERDVAPW